LFDAAEWQEFHRNLVETMFPGLQQQQVLVYNRVPKTGSTSLMNILYELQSINRKGSFVEIEGQNILSYS
jgi:hypothetical protein